MNHTLSGNHKGSPLRSKYPNDGFSQKLRITHYELRIDPDTHVRASLRDGKSTKCVDYPK